MPMMHVVKPINYLISWHVSVVFVTDIDAGLFNRRLLRVLMLTHLCFCSQVLGATFDGASINRRLVKLHNSSRKSFVHKVPNIYAPDKRDIYFISISSKPQETAGHQMP